MPEPFTEIIGAVIAQERARNRAIMAGLVAEIRREGKRAVDELREAAAERIEALADAIEQTRALRIQVADLSADVERLRRPVVSEGKPDLRAVN